MLTLNPALTQTLDLTLTQTYRPNRNRLKETKFLKMSDVTKIFDYIPAYILRAKSL